MLILTLTQLKKNLPQDKKLQTFLDSKVKNVANNSHISYQRECSSMISDIVFLF